MQKQWQKLMAEITSPKMLFSKLCTQNRYHPSHN